MLFSRFFVSWGLLFVRGGSGRCDGIAAIQNAVTAGHSAGIGGIADGHAAGIGSIVCERTADGDLSAVGERSAGVIGQGSAAFNGNGVVAFVGGAGIVADRSAVGDAAAGFNGDGAEGSGRVPVAVAQPAVVSNRAAHQKRSEIIDARGVISKDERINFINRVRTMASAVAKLYVAQREELGFPLCK